MNEKPLEDQRQRIDKWLFFSRLLKSRALAQDFIAAGSVRVNGHVVSQPSRLLKAGDRLDLMLEHRDVTLVVKGPGSRRGPPSEARALYDDLTPEQPRLTPFERAQRQPRLAP
jgi:ribosome-associated heat shock protein Hsp15